MMPDFLSSYRLDFTPLAPIHIGSGEDLDPTSYVLDADTLYEFSPSALAAALDETARDRLLGLVDGTGGERTLTRVRQFLYERREGLVAHASRAVRVATGVQELYESRIPNAAQSETKVINRFEIERVCSHPGTHAPILPGSSLKGAIRTALLNQENDGRSLKDRENSRQLQQRLFGYRSFEADPMRLIHVADAMGSGNGTMDELSADTAIVFAVNRKKITGKDRQEIRSQAEHKGLDQTLEVVPALRWRAFRGGLTIHRIDLRDGDRLPKPGFRWTAQDIAKACNRFYRRQFMCETEALRKRGLVDDRWYATIRKLQTNGLEELLDSNHAFLLRVGRHSGAESVTVDSVRNIRIMTPQGQPNRWEENATTWWLAADRTDAAVGLLPFGWVLVEMTEGDRVPAPRAELAEAFDSFHVESGERGWRTKVAQRRATLRQEQEAAALRRAEAERRRCEQEAAERRREEQRAAMTDEERELDELRTLLTEAQRPETRPQMQGGELAGRANQILKVATGWPEVSRLRAADLIEEIFRTIGFPKGRKRSERKRQIAALREDAK